MDTADGGIWKLTFYVDEIGDADWLFHCYPRTTVVIGLKALDYDNPDQSNIIPEGERHLKRAGMLCRNDRFQRYIRETYPESENVNWDKGENACVTVLHGLLGIESRSDLVSSQRAVDRFAEILSDFQKWLRTDI